MWRPFASSFVEHSLDSFIIRHEKTKSTIVYTEPAKDQPSPFELSTKDLEKRLDVFKKLKKKVQAQRRSIKDNDSLYQSRIQKQLVYKKKVKESFREEVKRNNSFSAKNKLKLGSEFKNTNGTERKIPNTRRKSILEIPNGFGLPSIKRNSIEPFSARLKQ